MALPVLKVVCMKPLRHSRQVVGFTLIEMLVVMGIIGILAALLLPAVNRGKLRAHQAVCINNLKQIGLAYQSFAHDHNGRFPTQVSVQDGGIEECRWEDPWTTNVIRSLQALSNELANPKVLICPSDTRTATNFAWLIESPWKANHCAHCSYRGNLRLSVADVGRPTTILVADRNLLPTDWPHYDRGMPTLEQTNYFSWGHDMHRYKGNLLFADGHVEWLPNGPALNTAMAQSLQPGRDDPAPPGDDPPTLAPPPSPDAPAHGRSPRPSNQPPPPSLHSGPAAIVPPVLATGSGLSGYAALYAQALTRAGAVRSVISRSNTVSRTSSSAPVIQPPTEPTEDMVETRFAGVRPATFTWCYLLLLLLVLLFIVYTIRREWSKRGPKQPPPLWIEQ
jgi:prepilin-type N-terminal cleavage/methylation domain-containing protein/prepilin-type processing-associated H-X9-DG protein